MKDLQKLASEYVPAPEDLSGVQLPASLLALSEAIAENTHEIWSHARLSDGWTYGPTLDEQNRRHPDLLPYSALTEGEKDYDRATAISAIKLIVKLGYTIRKEK